MPTIRRDTAYAQVADHYAKQIDSGTLKPGDYLPSTTSLLTEWGIARATVTRAMGELKNRGLVEQVPGKGIRVLAAATTPGPAQAGEAQAPTDSTPAVDPLVPDTETSTSPDGTSA